MTNINNFDLKDFNGLYLEDSYILNMIETPKLFSFQMEFVLTEDHPQYKAPLENEMYCYQHGEINFIEPKQVTWKYRNQKAASFDANGECDFGNIDIFLKSEKGYLLEGDWGSVVIKCDQLEVGLKEQSLVH